METAEALVGRSQRTLGKSRCEEQLPGFWWTHWLFPRLVLPYVRHLKGEDDKPLPPTKPRKQYKMAKELRGDDGTTEKPKKTKDSERQVDQVSAEHGEGVFTAPCLLWPWLLTPAWNARNLLQGGSWLNFGFPEDQRTPANMHDTMLGLLGY